MKNLIKEMSKRNAERVMEAWTIRLEPIGLHLRSKGFLARAVVEKRTKYAKPMKHKETPFDFKQKILKLSLRSKNDNYNL